MRRLETVEEKFDKRIEGAQALGSQGARASFSVQIAFPPSSARKPIAHGATSDAPGRHR